MSDRAQALDNRDRSHGATRKEIERRSTLGFITADKSAVDGDDDGAGAYKRTRLLEMLSPEVHCITNLIQN